MALKANLWHPQCACHEMIAEFRESRENFIEKLQQSAFASRFERGKGEKEAQLPPFSPVEGKVSSRPRMNGLQVFKKLTT